ncbi:MAG: PepSY-like domain-containing protein [Bacteroidales bacterium]|nr:PepSY-like domain-containing protein [Bacteroidales bacterium]
MKKTIFTLIAIFALSAFSYSSVAKEVAVDIKSIPATAQNFIKQNFADKKLLSIVKDSEILDTEYKAYFSDRTSITFTSKGEWKEIDGNKNCIPESTIPANIANYVAENYAGICISKIEIDKELFGFQYNIELLNGIDMKFDKNGAFLGFDD